MKKIIYWIIVAVLLAASLPVAPYAMAEDNGTRRGLANTRYKLLTEHRLKVGYIGGSITVGSGASNPDYSWRAKTTKWLKETYPAAEIFEINAGIGGFGSIPNVFRAKNQLLQGQPDLVFIDAAVNDYNQNEQNVKNSMEGLIRQIYQANPYADIVIVYALNRSGAETDYANGQRMKSVRWHDEIAGHYGIPAVNVGYALYQALASGNEEATWDLMFRDNEHPTDEGYSIYADSMRQYLIQELAQPVPDLLQAYDMPAKLHAGALDRADLVDGYELAVHGFARTEASMGGRHPHMIESDQRNATVVINFRGTAVGLYWLKSLDAGYVEWQIDDGLPRLLSGCDSTALTGSARGTYDMLAMDLPEGEHTLILRVTGDHVAGATGAWVRLGGIFVAERSLVPAEPLIIGEQEEEPLELLFEENFNAPPVGWNINSAFTRVQRPGGAAQDMSMYIPAGSANKSMTRSLNDYEGTMTLETDIRYEGAARQIKIPDILINGNQQGVLVSIINNKVSVPYLNDQGANVRAETAAAAGEWHRIVIELSTVTDTFTMWVNGKVLVQNVKFYNGNQADTISQIRYAATNAADPAFYVDNVRAYKGPARFPPKEKTLADYMLRAVLVRENDATAYMTGFKSELSAAAYRQNGILMVPLQELAEGFHADSALDEFTGTQTVSLHGRNAVIQAGANGVLVDGELVATDAPALIVNGRMHVSLATAAAALDKEPLEEAGSGMAFLAERGTLPLASDLTRVLIEAAALFEEAALPAAELYVSPSAQPGGEGTEAHPFASLEEVRVKVRQLLASGSTGDIHVNLREGTYRLDSTFVLTGEDSPGDPYKVTYRSYGQERAVIEGGQRITDWEPYRDGIYKAALPAGVNPLTLYENKQRAVMARYPDKGYSRAVAADVNPKSRFRFAPGDVPQVAHPEKLMVYAWPGGPAGYYNWSTMRAGVTGVDYGRQMVYLDRDMTYEMGTGSRYYVYNALELLDAPGEYYVDPVESMLYYKPYGDIAASEIVLPAVFDLVSIAGTEEAPARNIVLDGLELRNTELNKSLVSIADARNIEVRNSELYNSGHIGVHIKENAKNNRVENNLVYQTGFYGIFIVGKANTKVNETYGNAVVNNHVHHVGEMNGNAAGIRVMHASYSYIAYNKVDHSPRNGIHIYGVPDPNIMGKVIDDVTVTAGNVNDFKVARYNTVIYNDVSQVVQDSQDTNAIGMWGAGMRNVIRKNRIHDNDQPQVTTDASHSFWFPMYLDENSNGEWLESNILYRNQLQGGGTLRAGFHTNASKSPRVLNNLFLDTRYRNAPINSNDMNATDRTSKNLLAMRNILSGFNGGVYSFMKWTADTVEHVDYNLLNSGDGEYLIRGSSPFQTFAEWKDYGDLKYDANSLIGQPQFVAEETGDYRLRYGSPAYAVGFEDINVSDIGLRSDFLFAEQTDTIAGLYVYATGDSDKKAWAAVHAGDSVQLAADLRTQNGYAVEGRQATFAYTGGDPAVATVDGSGVVHAVGKGRAVIAVTAEKGGKTLQTSFEVVVEDAPAELHITGVKSMYEMGDSFDPVVLVKSEFGHLTRYNDVVLSAPDPGISIEQRTVTALAPGMYTIRAVSLSDPELTAEANFAVSGELLETVEVTVNKELYRAGEEIIADYRLFGSQGSEIDKELATIRWSGDGDGIIQVANGKILVLQEGVGTLSATAEIGGRIRTGTIKVAVMPADAQLPPGFHFRNYSPSAAEKTVGYAYAESERIRLVTTGNDAWGTADSMTFLAAEAENKERITVTVAVYALQNPPVIDGTGEVAIHAAAGVMMRAGDSPDSHNVFVRYRLNGDVIMSYRNETYPATSYQKGKAPGKPVELKLEKEGNRFTGYYKNEAREWVKIASVACEMGNRLLVGVGLQSGSKGNMNSAEFGDILIEPDVLAPVLTPGPIQRVSAGEALAAFTSNEAGRYYYAAVVRGAAAPVIDTTVADTVYGAVYAQVEHTFLAGGLLPQAMDLYITAKDEAGNVTYPPLKLEIPAYGDDGEGGSGGEEGGGTPGNGGNEGGGPGGENGESPGSEEEEAGQRAGEAAPGADDTSSPGRAAIVLDGVRYPEAGVLHRYTEEGREKAELTLDEEALLGLLDKARTGLRLVFPFPSGTEEAAGIISGRLLSALAKKQTQLSIQTEMGNYELDTATVSLQALLNPRKLAGAEPEETELRISLSRPSAQALRLLEKAAVLEGAALLRPALEWSVDAVYQGERTRISSLGAYLRIQLPVPQEGTTAAGIPAAVGVDSQGGIYPVPVRLTESNGMRFYEIRSLNSGLLAVVSRSVSFRDTAGHWAGESISAMASRLIVEGVREGEYVPDGEVTRAQFAALLVRALGLEPAGHTGLYPDVPAEQWYQGYVEAAASYGLVHGYEDGSFHPDEQVSRQQAMVMLARAVELTGSDLSVKSGMGRRPLVDYEDYGQVDRYALTAAEICLESGMISGRTDTVLAPGETVTRAEAAVMLERLLRQLGFI
ncbi:S-layer homology domain-containing protein [Paenibacillus sp. YN15]|uniref:S-layer homology domain-containing protein n=1 Tax=Paenibacillus sp. YN15 TaxID=1742774 RepID=UPI000DCF120F|nr:S-layer homology domain-containing protein [Paenibacillus sp. YN15]RAV04024.1 hypothetical protein DQG13_05960 [Paenibacillus sp. YN15]